MRHEGFHKLSRLRYGMSMANDAEMTMEFHADPALLDRIPHPYPAAQAAPEWLKNMPMATAADPEVATVKRCAPFLEAMTAGYIIPLVCDIVLDWKRDDAGTYHLEVDVPSSPADVESILR